MLPDYDEKLRASGSFCSVSILHQDGPISRDVYEVTLQLLKLAEECWSAESMAEFAQKFPPGTKSGGRMAAMVGSGFHGRLYDLAVSAQQAGRLRRDVVIALPVTRKNDPATMRRGRNFRSGPDFVLRGLIGGEQIDAAWDFTTSKALASHYDRDVLGKSAKNKPRPDVGIQQVEDTSNYWSSYIAICY